MLTNANIPDKSECPYHLERGRAGVRRRIEPVVAFPNALAAGMKTNLFSKASPNLIGRCERFIETIKLECLNKFIVFGRRHLDYLTDSFVEYYNHHRSHMERDHLPP